MKEKIKQQKTAHVHFRVPEGFTEMVNKAAKSQGVNASTFMRIAIQVALNRTAGDCE